MPRDHHMVDRGAAHRVRRDAAVAKPDDENAALARGQHGGQLVRYRIDRAGKHILIAPRHAAQLDRAVISDRLAQRFRARIV